MASSRTLRRATYGDGACNIGDALRMAQCDVGLISCALGSRDAPRLTPSHGDLHFEIVGDGLVAPGRLSTVEAQRKQIMKKLDLHETAELVRFVPRRQG